MIRLAVLLLGLAGGAAAAGSGRIDGVLRALSAAPVSDTFSFGLIGDSQIDHDSVFALILRAVAEKKPAFAVQVGDIIRGVTRDKAVLRAQWKRALDTLRALGKTPYLPLPGNHDISPGLVEEEAAWKRIWGPTHYEFTYGRCGFILFATDLSGGHAAMVREYAWLKKALEKHRKARATFVFMHRPLFAVDAEWRDTLTQWFERFGADYVLYGHQHVSAYEQKKGVRYLQVVSAGALGHPAAFGGFHHFALFTVRPDTIFFSLHGPGGQPLPGPTPASRSRAYSRIKDGFNLAAAPVLVAPSGFSSSFLALTVANPLPFPIVMSCGTDSLSMSAARMIAGGSATLLNLPLRVGAGLSFEPFRLDYRMVAVPDDTSTLEIRRPVFLNAAISSSESGMGAKRPVVLLSPNPESGKTEWLQGLKILEGHGVMPIYRYDDLKAALARNEGGLVFGLASDFSHKSELLEWFADHRNEFRQWLQKGGRALFSVPSRNPGHEFSDFGVTYVRKGKKSEQLVRVTKTGAPWIRRLNWKGEGAGDSARILTDGYLAPSGKRRYEVFLKDQEGRPVGVIVAVGRGALLLTTTDLLDMNANQNDLPVNLLWQGVLRFCIDANRDF